MAHASLIFPILCTAALLFSAVRSVTAAPGFPAIRAMDFAIPPVIVGLSDTLSEEDIAFFRRSADDLALTSGETPMILRTLSFEELISAVSEQEIDFAFTTAREFAVLERFHGARPLAGTIPPEGKSEQRAHGLALAVPLGSEGALRAGSLKWCVESSLAAELLPLARLYSDSARIPMPASVEQIPSLTPAHFSDAAVLLPVCREERLHIIGPQSSIFEPKRLPELACTVTGELFPGPVFSRALHTDSVRAEAIGDFLKGSSPSEGWRWSIPPDTVKLHAVLDQFDPTYTPGFELTARDFFMRHIIWFATGLGLLLVLLGNAVWLERKVRIRTLQLERVQAEKTEALEKAAAVEKASVVSQMSSIVAHEIRQPLTAMRNYLGSLRRRTRKGNLPADELLWVLNSMTHELERADGIVEHVRSYAKSKENVRTMQNVSGVIRKETALDYAQFAKTRIDDGIEFEADELEIRLIVTNLLKNARDAVRNSAAPFVLLTWTRAENFAILRVEDNGPAISDEAMNKLTEPLHTTKADGLGLGLAIVATVCESYGATLTFSRRMPSGLTAEIRFPMPSSPRHDDSQ